MAETRRNVTEVSCINLNGDVNVLDGFSEAAKTYENVLSSTLNQPGAQRLYTGHEIDDPSNLWLFVDWETSEHSENYRRSKEHLIAKSLASYGKFGPTTTSFRNLVSVNPFPPEDVLDSARSPVTEVLLADFPLGYDKASRDTAINGLGQYFSHGLKTSPDWRGMSYGWSVNDDVPVQGGSSNTSVTLVCFFGWPSVEACERFRRTEAFTSNIGHLRELPGLQELTTFYVSCYSKVSDEVDLPHAEMYHEHGGSCGSGGCC